MSEDEIGPFIEENPCTVHPSTPLIICLIESLENWAVTSEVMPNLTNFILKEEHLLYAKNIKPERLYGSSSDGQMIVETGLLPIQEGAACFRYYGNVFPCLNNLYSDAQSAVLIPHEMSVWNQEQMNIAYGFDTGYVSSPYDKELFADLYDLTRQYQSILAITMSSHTPFLTYSDSSSLNLPDDMPNVMSNYLKTLNVADNGLKILLDGIVQDSILRHSTVVITADHNIFDIDKREEFYSYCQRSGDTYNVMAPNCPLIIYSPLINGRHITEEPAYQMDIYPTILDILGVEYYWKGVGVSLLKPNFNEQRVIQESSAFSLCDRLIRSDYFKDFKWTN